MNFYGLIGYPLGHSFSKKYFTEKFAKEGITNVQFELYPITAIASFPQLAALPGLRGLAVTIPYKQSVLAYLDEVTNEAVEIGAVNCIALNNGRSKGYNTDVKGFQTSFVTALLPTHKRALVLGTGGAAKAVIYVLSKLNIPYTEVSRSTAPNRLDYSQISQDVMQKHQVIINCTPLGMSPDVSSAPEIPYQYITESHYCYDLIYTPDETLFLKRAKEQGATVKNGYDMLILQAEENWRIWNQ